MKDSKTIYELELHEIMEPRTISEQTGDRYTITKVHNGWLYHICTKYGTSVTFVPQYQTEPQL
jgi:hypothetical protein